MSTPLLRDQAILTLARSSRRLTARALATEQDVKLPVALARPGLGELAAAVDAAAHDRAGHSGIGSPIARRPRVTGATLSHPVRLAGPRDNGRRFEAPPHLTAAIWLWMLFKSKENRPRMPRTALGDVEHFVLIALLHLGGESYSVPIMDEIRQRTGRDVAKAAVYIALRRLEEKQLLVSRVGEATSERGGRAKRYFRLKPAGARHLRAARNAFVQMWAGADLLLPKTLR
jgi:PadR family transcriptional regulator